MSATQVQHAAKVYEQVGPAVAVGKEAPDRADQYAKQIADMFIKSLSEDTPKYRNPWKDGLGITPFGQYNAVSGKQYSGTNQAMLTFTAMEKGYDDDRWMTFKQGTEAGGKVRKGEKGTLIRIFREKSEEVENGKGETEEVKKGFFTFAYVFNAQQFDGLKQRPALDFSKTADDMHKEAEEVLKRSGAAIFNDTRNKAYYSPSKDEIHLPPMENMRSASDYYATALHELGHWTGHPSRLNRETLTNANDKTMYAKEELRAEIASMMMAQRIGVRTELGQHQAYVKSWVQILQEKPNEILKACSDAERICHHLGVNAPEHERMPVNAQDPKKAEHVKEGKERFARIERQSQALSAPEFVPVPTQTHAPREHVQSR